MPIQATFRLGASQQRFCDSLPAWPILALHVQSVFYLVRYLYATVGEKNRSHGEPDWIKVDAWYWMTGTSRLGSLGLPVLCSEQGHTILVTRVTMRYSLSW